MLNPLFRLTSEGKTVKRASFSTISVFVPMPVGTTSIETSPAQAKVDGHLIS